MQQSNDEHIGIISMECYFPKYYVSQTELESFNKVSPGKYTIGLGQDSMSFVTQREDICSISLTVLSNLLTKNNICYNEIGWICVATETIIDHSKSISSMLMQLFESNGCHNTEIEGIDVKHACYGGTFALFTAFDRISSKYWDGKYCIVICADIAEYAQGPARCTGGCGAIALLIGTNGCLELNPVRASYKAHEYDFYKPNLDSSYPVVNGALSNECYLNALDSCYDSLKRKYGKYEEIYSPFNTDYWVFHAPYNKLISKSFGRLVYNDFMRKNAQYYDEFKDNKDIIALFKKYENIAISDTVNSRQVIKGFEKISKKWYNQYVASSTLIPKEIGNCYTASLFMGLLSLICCVDIDIEQQLCGKNISLFAYGSGTVASIYSLKVHSNESAIKQLKQIVVNNDIHNRLQQRRKISCDEYSEILNNKRKRDAPTPHTLVCEDTFYGNTYYLSKINAKKERFYEKYIAMIDEEKGSISNDVEAAINENIARNKEDNMFKVANIAHFVDGKLSKCVEKMVDDSALSKKNAIKIDNFIHKSTKTVTNCSYS